MSPRIYIDTSIVGGFFDKEFSADTKALFGRLEKREVVFVLSDVLKKELLHAPSQARNLLQQYEKHCFEHVELTQEAELLANCYIAEKVVGATNLADCQHIAIATINKVDVLASWNFKHIVNYRAMTAVEAVNIKEGYAPLRILSPSMLLEEE